MSIDQNQIGVLVNQIKTKVSNIIGANHSLFAYVTKEEYVGIRTVEINICHEANMNNNKERVQKELAEFGGIVINTLSEEGYSVTEPENLNTFINGQNMGVIVLRCSLKPIAEKEPQPQPQAQDQAQAQSPNQIPNPLAIDRGPMIEWGQ